MPDEKPPIDTIITPDAASQASAEPIVIPVTSESPYSSVEDLLGETTSEDMPLPTTEVASDVPPSSLFGIEQPKIVDSASEPVEVQNSVPEVTPITEPPLTQPPIETPAVSVGSTIADKIAKAKETEEKAHAEFERLNSILEETKKIDAEIQEVATQRAELEKTEAEKAQQIEAVVAKEQELASERQELASERQELTTQQEATKSEIQKLTDESEKLVAKRQALLDDGGSPAEETIPKPPVSIPVNEAEVSELPTTEPEIVDSPSTDEIAQVTAPIGPKKFEETEQNTSEVDPEKVIEWSSKVYLELSKVWTEKFGIEIPKITEMANILSASYKIINKLETDLPSSKDRLGVILVPPSSLVLDENGQIKSEIKAAQGVSLPGREVKTINDEPMPEQNTWNVIVTVKDDEWHPEDNKLSTASMDSHKISPYQVTIMNDLLGISASPEMPVFFTAELTKN